jgi:putative transcriptional regulator
MALVESLKGHLLVADAGLYDPNFRKTVVLVAEHNDEGALGVVLNQRSGLTLGDAVPDLALALGDADLFVGGPVMADAVVVIADLGDPGRLDLPILGTVGFVTSSFGSGLPEGFRAARVFAGYSGWAAGQLEFELAEDSWLTLPALPADAFADPDHLWVDVVRRLGGGHRLLATLPLDPKMN